MALGKFHDGVERAHRALKAERDMMAYLDAYDQAHTDGLLARPRAGGTGAPVAEMPAGADTPVPTPPVRQGCAPAAGSSRGRHRRPAKRLAGWWPWHAA